MLISVSHLHHKSKQLILSYAGCLKVEKKEKFIFQKWHYTCHKGISLGIPFTFCKKI